MKKEILDRKFRVFDNRERWEIQERYEKRINDAKELEDCM